MLCAAWLALRWLPAGADGHNPLPYMIALIPFLWIPTAVSVAVAAIMQLWILCAAAVLLLTVLTVVEYPYYRGLLPGSRSRKVSGTSPTNGERSNQTHAMTLNCRFGRASAKHIVQIVRDRDIAVLALQELTDELVEALQEYGIKEYLPYSQFGSSLSTDNGGFNGVWTRYSPISQNPDSIDILAAQVPSITFAFPFADAPTYVQQEVNRQQPSAIPLITVFSAHTKSPMRGCRQWSRGIMNLGRLAEHSDSAHLAVVMGDLNSHLDHPSFRKLLRSGFQDASLMEAKKPNTTFSSHYPWPRIELDHVIASQNVGFSDVESVKIEGSDHLALCVSLRLV